MKKYVICLLIAVFWLSFSSVEATKTILNPFAKYPQHRQKISDKFSDLTSIVTITRITGDTTLTATAHKVFVDTDGGAITITLPAGVNGTEYVVYNTGSSGNNLTLTPNGAELLLGANSNFTVRDGEVEVLTFENTEGWR